MRAYLGRSPPFCAQAKSRPASAVSKWISPGPGLTGLFCFPQSYAELGATVLRWSDLLDGLDQPGSSVWPLLFRLAGR